MLDALAYENNQAMQLVDELMADNAALRSRIATLEAQVEQAREIEQRLGDYCQAQCGTRGECCRAHGLELSCAICAALDGSGR